MNTMLYIYKNVKYVGAFFGEITWNE